MIKDFEKEYYKKELENTETVLQWMKDHILDLMNTDTGISLEEYTTMKVALKNYFNEVQQKLEERGDTNEADKIHSSTTAEA